jgi:hypothetical protein
MATKVMKPHNIQKTEKIPNLNTENNYWPLDGHVLDFVIL